MFMWWNRKSSNQVAVSQIWNCGFFSLRFLPSETAVGSNNLLAQTSRQYIPLHVGANSVYFWNTPTSAMLRVFKSHLVRCVRQILKPSNVSEPICAPTVQYKVFFAQMMREYENDERTYASENSRK